VFSLPNTHRSGRVWCSQNPRLPISTTVASTQTSLCFGLTQHPEVLAFATYSLACLLQFSIHWAASLCPKEGNFLQSIIVWALPVTTWLLKLRSDLHSLPLALIGQRPPCYFTSFQNASTQPKCLLPSSSTRPLPRATLVGW
jgi:hypothetical protein